MNKLSKETSMVKLSDQWSVETERAKDTGKYYPNKIFKNGEFFASWYSSGLNLTMFDKIMELEEKVKYLESSNSVKDVELTWEEFKDLQKFELFSDTITINEHQGKNLVGVMTMFMKAHQTEDEIERGVVNLKAVRTFWDTYWGNNCAGHAHPKFYDNLYRTTFENVPKD